MLLRSITNCDVYHFLLSLPLCLPIPHLSLFTTTESPNHPPCRRRRLVSPLSATSFPSHPSHPLLPLPPPPQPPPPIAAATNYPPAAAVDAGHHRIHFPSSPLPPPHLTSQPAAQPPSPYVTTAGSLPPRLLAWSKDPRARLKRWNETLTWMIKLARAKSLHARVRKADVIGFGDSCFVALISE
ncbi:hypothetical protein AKJ16_DCAP00872 [Drosera capensis]